MKDRNSSMLRQAMSKYCSPSPIVLTSPWARIFFPSRTLNSKQTNYYFITEFDSLTGVNFFVRKMAGMASPVSEISVKEGDKVHITLVTSFMTQEDCFSLGEEFDKDMRGNKMVVSYTVISLIVFHNSPTCTLLHCSVVLIGHWLNRYSFVLHTDFGCSTIGFCEK